MCLCGSRRGIGSTSHERGPSRGTIPACRQFESCLFQMQPSRFRERELTPYEIQRLQHIQNNNLRLAALGLREAYQQVQHLGHKTIQQKRKRSHSSLPADRRCQPQRDAKTGANEAIQHQFRVGELRFPPAIRRPMDRSAGSGHGDVSNYEKFMRFFRAKKVREHD